MFFVSQCWTGLNLCCAALCENSLRNSFRRLMSRFHKPAVNYTHTHSHSPFMYSMEACSRGHKGTDQPSSHKAPSSPSVTLHLSFPSSIFHWFFPLTFLLLPPLRDNNSDHLILLLSFPCTPVLRLTPLFSFQVFSLVPSLPANNQDLLII